MVKLFQKEFYLSLMLENKWLKENNVKYISLEIHLENKKALKFYRNLGFEDYTLKLAKKI